MNPVASANRAFAHALVTSLHAHGVRQLVVSPGSRSAPLAIAAYERALVRLHVVVDERSAGFVAVGLSRATGSAVALLCTSGSAPAHYLPAVLEASESGLPLVLLTADRPAELHHVGAPQTVEQSHLFGEHVRLRLDVGPDDLEHATARGAMAAARAVTSATGANPGPVHVNLRFSEPLWEPDTDAPSANAHRTAPALATLIQAATRAVAPTLVRALALQLVAHTKGVIYAGPNAALTPEAQRRLGAAVAQLGERLGWPVLAEASSGLRWPAREGVLTAYEHLARAAGDDLTPSVVLQLGRAPTCKAVTRWLAGVPRIVLAPGPVWSDPELATICRYEADPLALCQALIEQVDPTREVTKWRACWLAADAAATKAADAQTQDDLWEGAIARAVVATLPESAWLHVASSMPIRDLDAWGSARATPLFSSANRGVNGIDGTLATATGIALGQEHPVCVLLGDVATAHDLGSLATARTLGASLTVVVIQNGGGKIFDFLPVAAHATALRPLFHTPSAIDFVAVASALGWHAERVDSLAALRQALAAAAQTGGLRLIEVTAERADHRSRHEAAFAAVTRALREQP